jgi:ABC-type uncharacterized transport system ATPase subunit
VTDPRPAAGDGLALGVRGLRKRYGSVVALDGLDLSVPRGLVYGFLGPNGAGKTTTMRLLAGLMRPDAGTIELFGRPFNQRDRRRLFDVGAGLVAGLMVFVFVLRAAVRPKVTMALEDVGLKVERQAAGRNRRLIGPKRLRPTRLGISPPSAGPCRGRAAGTFAA